MIMADGALDQGWNTGEGRSSDCPVVAAADLNVVAVFPSGAPGPRETKPSALAPGGSSIPINRPTLRDALAAKTDRFPHIEVVRDYEVLRQIGRIRHQQYVSNQGKPYRSMVLDRDCLIEAGDFVSVNIYARDYQGITCAMRIGRVADDANPYRELLENAARRFDVPLDAALTCTRLVRAPRHSGRHVVDLIRFLRWQAVRAGWRYCIMQTAERLVPFFLRFEFRETGIWSDDPTAGRLHTLIVDTRMQPMQEGAN